MDVLGFWRLFINGIETNGQQDRKVPMDFSLHAIDRRIQVIKGLIPIHLYMDGPNVAVRTIVIKDQIMGPLAAPNPAANTISPIMRAVIYSIRPYP